MADKPTTLGDVVKTVDQDHLKISVTDGLIHVAAKVRIAHREHDDRLDSMRGYGYSVDFEHEDVVTELDLIARSLFVILEMNGLTEVNTEFTGRPFNQLPEHYSTGVPVYGTGPKGHVVVNHPAPAAQLLSKRLGKFINSSNLKEN